MKKTLCSLLILFCLSISITAQQSTTGPTPPPGTDRGKINATEAGQVVISGVPSYLWQHGCGPTALGMVVGYYDTHGYPDLIPGNASTQTTDVNDAIANDPHYNDYSLPLDTYPDLFTDKSETGGAHASNCIADFMETSWSSRTNRYGWSYNTDVNPSFEDYVQMMNSNYITNTTFVYNDPNMWNLYRNEIDNNRPVVFLVDSDGDGNTDHFVTGIGYDDNNLDYAIYDTWDNNIHWFDWHMMSNGNPWGIYTMHMLEIVSNNNTTVLISPDNQTVFISTSFTTTVEIEQVQNLGGFELDIDFDPLLLQANTVTLENFLSSTGRTVFPLANSINNTTGLIEYAATTLGPIPPGPDGDGILLTIEWTSTPTLSAETTTDLLIQNIQVTQPNATLIPLNLQNASVTVTPCYVHDFDCDCDVDIVDITMAAYCYGTSTGNPNYNPTYDLDSDGDIDIVDITVVAYDYGWACTKNSDKNKLGYVNEGVVLGVLSNEDSLSSDGTYEIQIYIENINQFGAYEFALSYDPACMEVLNIESGDFLESTNRKSFPVEKFIDNNAGELKYAITTLGSEIEGASGSGTLLKITCRALSDGCLNPELKYVQLVQVDGERIDYNLKYYNIDIEDNDHTCILNCYPNPFNEEMTVQYWVAEEGEICFKINDVTGKLIMQTEPACREVGKYNTVISRGELAPGLYFYYIENNGVVLDLEKILIR